MRQLSDLKSAPERLEVEREHSKNVVRTMVCKDCHSTLVAYSHPSDRDLEIIACSECWLECTGFISRVSAENLALRGSAEKREIERNYPEYFGKDEDEDKDDLIESLGY